MPIISAGDSKSATTAGAGAVEIGMDMVPRRQYLLTARGADLWFRVVAAGGSGAAVAGDGSHFLLQGESRYVAAIGSGNGPAIRNRVSVVRDGATDATGVLSELVPVQPF